MRDDYLTITQADVSGWNSCRHDRIDLPYRSTDDILYNANMLVVAATPYTGSEEDMDAISEWDNECLRILDNSSITATLKILPYRDRLIAGIGLIVDTADGQHLTQRICGNADGIESILEEFFRRGAAGLSPVFREHWTGMYSEYKQKK